MTPDITPQVRPTGPIPADIMIVGEAPGRNEVNEGKPFVGASGEELTRMLHEAGFIRSECFLTNVARRQPPNNDISHFYKRNTAKIRIAGEVLEAGMAALTEEIHNVQPTLIICLGDTALWALTGERGITKWRGSILQYDDGAHRCKVLPTYHPAAVLRQWSWRAVAIHDLARARTEAERGREVALPDWDFVIRPGFEQVIDRLVELKDYAETYRDEDWPLELAADIETRNSHISCFGIAWSETEAITIPFMAVDHPEGYWSLEEETAIIYRITELFKEPNIHWIFQNGLYDLQYFARYWGVVPQRVGDTMIAWHVLWAGLPKSLDFIASLCCDYYRFWKDDGKEWDIHIPEEQHWEYNSTDCVRTLECWHSIQSDLDKFGQREQYDFQMQNFWMAFRMMLRGVNTSRSERQRLSQELLEEEWKRIAYITEACGQELNPSSPKQMQDFFYGELGLPVQKNRKTGRPTCNSEALQKLAKKQPLIKPIVDRIEELRSIKVFRSTFVNMKLDIDGRLRCSYNVAGTETFRYSSSANAFGSGGNLQNIPKGDPDDAERGPDSFRLPNIRKLFLPDPDYTIVECDLDRADAQVVAWEAGAEDLKQIFREGLDLHTENARTIFGPRAGSRERQMAKIGVHATNYGASARTLAAALGIPVHAADKFQRRWFAAHPAIHRWHRDTEYQLQTTRTVTNRFGFRRFYFDRVDSILPEALAWIPQSTVALVIDKGLVRVDQELRGVVETLMQVHDSGIFQILTSILQSTLPKLMECLRVQIPYEDPLTIPVGAEISEVSWGDCKTPDWL